MVLLAGNVDGPSGDRSICSSVHSGFLMPPPSTREWPEAGGCGGNPRTHVLTPQPPLLAALSVTHLPINNPAQHRVAEISKRHCRVSESATQKRLPRGPAAGPS